MKEYRYDGTNRLALKELPTGAGEQAEHKEELTQRTRQNMAEAAALQEKLYASGREGLVIAIQARDAAGKDSLIKKVFSGLNPAALEVHAFKTPSKEDLSHDYLWRVSRALPARGKIGIFNRSHYEDVLVTRVHQMEKGYLMPKRVVDDDHFYQKRYRQIRNWEQYLYENGYRVVKLLLNVGREEQKKRFIDRLEREDKHWKLSLNDMAERGLWDAYEAAYEDAVNATATKESPWYVLPADDKWYTRYLVSEILADTLRDMDVSYPPLDPEEAALIPAVMERLRTEKR